jgi:isoquinoline 1-oxidoreductase beta subunit
MNARKKLKTEWEPISETKETVVGWRGDKREVVVPAGLESTSEHLKKMAERAKGEVKELRKDGDPETAFKNAAQVIERTYHAPFLAHNCMEPMNFFAHVTDEKALLVGPLQGPGWIEPSLSKILNLPPEKIEIQMTRMGGGFGRRAYGHFITEAALISKKIKSESKYEYGLKGLAKILGCSVSKASEIKSSGILDEAIIQNGNIIIIDKEKALQLFAKK